MNIRTRNFGIYLAERVSPSLSELDVDDDDELAISILSTLVVYQRYQVILVFILCSTSTPVFILQ